MMHLPTLFLALVAAASVTAAPAAPSFAEMQGLFSSSKECQLPVPEASCSGAKRSDIIVIYASTTSQTDQSLFLNAAKAAGGSIVYEWKDFGFSGFVPEGVVSLLKAYGEVLNIAVSDNACVRIPVCGEEPC